MGQEILNIIKFGCRMEHQVSDTPSEGSSMSPTPVPVLSALQASSFLHFIMLRGFSWRQASLIDLSQ